jgi:hypothetical protein
MANLYVSIPSPGCLKVIDGEEYTGNSFESGMALRRVIRSSNGTITWQARSSDGALTITYASGNGPFQSAPQTTVTGGITKVVSGPLLNGASGRYKYTITLGGVTEDPQIIVDTTPLFPPLAKKKTASKKKG